MTKLTLHTPAYRFKMHIEISCLMLLLVVNVIRISCWQAREEIVAENRKSNRKEVFMFSTAKHNYNLYDWSKITTLVVCYDPDKKLIDLAHSHKALVTYLTDFPRSILTNETQIDQWVAKHVNYTVTHQLDGVNIDYEEEMDVKIRDAFTSLIKKLTSKLKSVIPGAQVTIDFASWPRCCFDYKSIVDIVDFAFIMAYDEWGQRPVAWANSALNVTVSDIKQYLSLVQSDKLVLGLPWYGYDYPCVSYSVEDRKCHCQKDSAWNVNSGGEMERGIYHRGIERRNNGRRVERGNYNSDIESGIYVREMKSGDYDRGIERGYSSLMEQMKTSITGRLWDKVAQSPYFAYLSIHDNKTHQVWFDDAESLAIKYQLSTEFNLRGVGVWEADSLIYDDTPEMRKYLQDMWGTLP